MIAVLYTFYIKSFISLPLFVVDISLPVDIQQNWIKLTFKREQQMKNTIVGTIGFWDMMNELLEEQNK